MDPSLFNQQHQQQQQQQLGEPMTSINDVATCKQVLDLRNQQQQSKRPYSAEVISMREGFFNLNSDALKSESDSNLGFKDTKPEVQSTVNDRIARNMSAFLSFTNPLVDGGIECANKATALPLKPEPVSTNTVHKPKQHQPQWTRSMDPLLLTTPGLANSFENLYEEIGDSPRRSQSPLTTKTSPGSTDASLRPRPKGNLHIPQEVEGAYRKSSLDAYAQSVKKDFDLLAQQLGPRNNTASSSSCGNLPERVSSLNISTEHVHHYPSVQNTHYLQKYDSVIPVSKVKKNDNLSNPQSNMASSTNYLQPQQTHQQNKIGADRSPDYYQDFLLRDQKLNHFTYDSKAPSIKMPQSTAATSSEVPSTKERSRQAAQNYSDNKWDSFDDCVKDPKKLEKNRRSKSSGKRISWPKNSGETVNSPSTQSSAVGCKEEFSDKFKMIRTILPLATVGECLEGLRSSANNVEGAVRYIQILKLYRFNYGFSFEECEQLLEMHSFDYLKAEQELKVRHVKRQFNELDLIQVQDTLCLCQWDVTETLLTVFLQRCSGFGLDEQRARTIFKENQEPTSRNNIVKALEMAKIVRVAEITSKPEHVCFKTLTHCKWSIERAVNHIFSS